MFKEEKELKVLELFSGIRATSKALQNIGIVANTTTVEFDPDVQKIANKLWDTPQEETRDVTKFNPYDSYDLLVAGFPCQPFSKMGKGLGYDDERGKLYKDTLRIIEKVKPKNLILENVSSITSDKHKHIVDDILSKLESWGYKINQQKINSKYFLPQNRPRFFIYASIEGELNDIKVPLKNNTSLKDFLEEKVDAKYIYDFNAVDKKKTKKWIIQNGYIGPESKNNKGETDGFRRFYKDTYTHKGALLASGGGTGVVVGWNDKYDNYNSEQVRQLLEQGKIELRKITPTESLLLQGWKKKDIKKIINEFPASEILHVAGNSMTIPVMEYILKELFKNERKFRK